MFQFDLLFVRFARFAPQLLGRGDGKQPSGGDTLFVGAGLLGASALDDATKLAFMTPGQQRAALAHRAAAGAVVDGAAAGLLGARPRAERVAVAVRFLLDQVPRDGGSVGADDANGLGP